jgi:ubiquinone biosynthesis protein COQ9
MSDPLDPRRGAVLMAALSLAPALGWTPAMVSEAGRQAGEGEAELGLLFPEGVADLLSLYSDRLDAAMAATLAAAPLESMKIRERIKLGLKVRIEAVAPDLEAGRRAAALFMLPPYAPLGLKCALRTVDMLWRSIGDRSTDFNFYTKRALALGVYLSTLVFWFRDRSPEKEESWRFLDQRLSDVMVIQGAKIQARKLAAYLPSPWAVLGALRYPDRQAGDAPDPP